MTQKDKPGRRPAAPGQAPPGRAGARGQPAGKQGMAGKGQHGYGKRVQPGNRPKAQAPLPPQVAEALAREGLLDTQAYQKALGGSGAGAPRGGKVRPAPPAPVGKVRTAPPAPVGKVRPAPPAPGGKVRTAPPAPRRPAPAPAARRALSGEPERLHKVMAGAGIASRRAAEELIVAGRVKVNGEVVTKLGTRVVAGRDRIEVDGRPIDAVEKLLYVVLNKPRHHVTTLHDPQGRPTVMDLLRDLPVRVFPVGRLDFDTEGLLLLTNDGELAHALMHPSQEIWKTYVVRVRGVPSAAKLRQLEQGVELDDGPTAPARCRLLGVRADRRTGNQIAWVEISIHEGRNRQVRRMFEHLGHEVIGLQRTRLGPLRLVGLAPGEFRCLTLRDIQSLRQYAGLRPEPPRDLAPVPQAPVAPRVVGAPRAGGAPRARAVPGAAVSHPAAPAAPRPAGPGGRLTPQVVERAVGRAFGKLALRAQERRRRPSAGEEN